jgi:hypothetical protein
MGESYKNRYEKGHRGAFLPRKMPLYEIREIKGKGIVVRSIPIDWNE